MGNPGSGGSPEEALLGTADLWSRYRSSLSLFAHMHQWVKPPNFPFPWRGAVAQLSVLPGTPANSAGPFLNADPDTLSTPAQPPPPPRSLFPRLLISLPQVLLFLNPSFFRLYKRLPSGRLLEHPRWSEREGIRRTNTE